MERESASMRTLMGMGYGALYGLLAGVASALVVSLAVGAFGLVGEGPGAALALIFLYAFFGSIVGAVIGALVGAIAGALLAALKAEAHAPVIAALASGGPALLVSILIAIEDRQAPQTGTVQAVVAVAMIVAVFLFTAIGYGAGVAFAKTARKLSIDSGHLSGRPSEPTSGMPRSSIG